MKKYGMLTSLNYSFSMSWGYIPFTPLQGQLLFELG